MSNPNTAGTAKLVINTMVQMKGHDEAMKYFVELDKDVYKRQTLYLSTSGGLRTWKPGQEEPKLLVSMDELQAQGIGFDTLIYADSFLFIFRNEIFFYKFIIHTPRMIRF